MKSRANIDDDPNCRHGTRSHSPRPGLMAHSEEPAAGDTGQQADVEWKFMAESHFPQN